MTEKKSHKISSLHGLNALDENSIYKVFTLNEWEVLKAQGNTIGSADDQRDGYIHLSLASQVETTLDKHIADQSDLVLVTVQAQRLGSQLKWERSREDELFPHLYAELPLSLCKLIATRKDASTGWQPEHA